MLLSCEGEMRKSKKKREPLLKLLFGILHFLTVHKKLQKTFCLTKSKDLRPPESLEFVSCLQNCLSVFDSCEHPIGQIDFLKLTLKSRPDMKMTMAICQTDGRRKPRRGWGESLQAVVHEHNKHIDR
jgi:hypothetical protein